MIELAKHIEVLLLENDCVIVPELGGFIAHYCAAKYDEESAEFMPPMRTIGFNPQLKMNDGLLAQSYMRAYNTDFPDATRKIEKTVENLKRVLYKDGQVVLNHVGTIYYNMNGVYEFEPNGEAFFTPPLYGLQKFAMPKLADVAEESTFQPTETPRVHLPHRQMQWIKNAVAVAAAILLFFVLSNPVENTYVDTADYASLGTEGLFNAIRNRSMVSTGIGKAVSETAVTKPAKKQNKAIVPVAIREEKVPNKKTDAVTSATIRVEPRKEKKDTASVIKKEKKAQPTKKAKDSGSKKKGKHHLIVASLNTASDAQSEVARLQKNGYTDAQVIEADNRYRVAVGSYDNISDAYQRANQIRQQSGMEAAWVYTTK